jgi:hypothetical protein
LRSVPVPRVSPVGPLLLLISRRHIGGIALARLALESGGSSRVLRLLRIALRRIVRRTVALAWARLLSLRIAGWGVAGLWRREGVSAIRASLGARLVPGNAAIRARWRLVGLHSCAAALPHATGPAPGTFR